MILKRSHIKCIVLKEFIPNSNLNRPYSNFHFIYLIKYLVLFLNLSKQHINKYLVFKINTLMKQLLLLIIFLPFSTNGQTWTEDFETPPIHVWVDSNSTDSLWQIGKPNKPYFNSAVSGTKVIITDTINPYPPNSMAVFYAEFELGGYNTYIEWHSKIDTEIGHAGGTIELSFNRGAHWIPIYGGQWFDPFSDTTYNWYDSAFIYSQPYGFDVSNNGPNINDSINGMPSHQGSSQNSFWEFVHIQFHCMAVKSGKSNQNFLLRFTFYSDSIISNRDGWMLDDFYVFNYGGCSGINEITNVISNIYPNPSNEFISIELNNHTYSMNYISISDVNGREIKRLSNLNNEYVQINVSNFPSGVYFVKLFNEYGTLLGKEKLIIQ